VTNDGLNSFSQARTHPATESEVAEEAIRQKRGTALSQSEREQLILTCINALGSQMAELRAEMGKINTLLDQSAQRSKEFLFREEVRIRGLEQKRAEAQAEDAADRAAAQAKETAYTNEWRANVARAWEENAVCLAGISRIEATLKANHVDLAKFIHSYMVELRQRPQPKRRKGKRPARKNGNA
jgi:hypothetical protein